MAFGAVAVCIYGYNSYSTHGAHGAQKHIPVLHFYYLDDCIRFLRSRGCKYFYSVSPLKVSNSKEVETFKFSETSAFLVATGRENEVHLTPDQIAASDDILHAFVPSLEFESLLHYNSKLSICFDTFATQASYEATEYIREKYIVDASPVLSEEVLKEYDEFVKTLHDNPLDTDDDSVFISDIFQSNEEL